MGPGFPFSLHDFNARVCGGIGKRQALTLCAGPAQVLERQINKKRDECEQRIVACKGRETLLEEKQFKIQEAIKRFDKFIQENDVKRSRAAKKERDERQERIAKEVEAEEHKAKLQGLQVLAPPSLMMMMNGNPSPHSWLRPKGQSHLKPTQVALTESNKSFPYIVHCACLQAARLKQKQELEMGRVSNALA